MFNHFYKKEGSVEDQQDQRMLAYLDWQRERRQQQFLENRQILQKNMPEEEYQQSLVPETESQLQSQDHDTDLPPQFAQWLQEHPEWFQAEKSDLDTEQSPQDKDIKNETYRNRFGDKLQALLDAEEAFATDSISNPDNIESTMELNIELEEPLRSWLEDCSRLRNEQDTERIHM